jgi:hypothetical protein
MRHYIDMLYLLSRAKSRSKYIGFQLIISCYKVEYRITLMLHSLVINKIGNASGNDYGNAYSNAYGDTDSDTSGDVNGDPNDT